MATTHHVLQVNLGFWISRQKDFSSPLIAFAGPWMFTTLCIDLREEKSGKSRLWRRSTIPSTTWWVQENSVLKITSRFSQILMKNSANIYFERMCSAARKGNVNKTEIDTVKINQLLLVYGNVYVLGKSWCNPLKAGNSSSNLPGCVLIMETDGNRFWKLLMLNSNLHIIRCAQE